MPTITGLQAQGKNRMKVYLDEEYAFSLCAAVAMALHVGEAVDNARVAVLQRRDALETAHARALRYLSYRPRSRAEVRSYLREKGYIPETVTQTLERLAKVGLLDDKEFAHFWIENRETFRPKGAVALRYELRQKGISAEIIDSAVSEIDEETSAMKAGRRTAIRLARTDEQTFRRRLLGFLQRRGFSYDVSCKVTRHLWHEYGGQQETEHG